MGTLIDDETMYEIHRQWYRRDCEITGCSPAEVLPLANAVGKFIVSVAHVLNDVNWTPEARLTWIATNAEDYVRKSAVLRYYLLRNAYALAEELHTREFQVNIAILEYMNDNGMDNWSHPFVLAQLAVLRAEGRMS